MVRFWQTLALKFFRKEEEEKSPGPQRIVLASVCQVRLPKEKKVLLPMGLTQT